MWALIRSGVFRHMLVAALILASAVPVLAGAITYISEGYATDEDLSLGSIVGLKENTHDQVVAASASSADSIIGVVISDANSLLSVSNSGQNQVQIASQGRIQVLVTDLNGKITQGDHITASPIKGIGMRATTNTKVVGIAQGEIYNTADHTYKDSDGNEQKVKIGQAPVLVNVGYFFKEPDKTIIPAAVQNVANSVANREVSTLPILLSIAIFIVTLIVVVSIIYSMIRSSIISVGRNPRSQSAIYRDLIQLSVLVLVILGVGLASIYFILARF